jgi:hypothetical protein
MKTLFTILLFFCMFTNTYGQFVQLRFNATWGMLPEIANNYEKWKSMNRYERPGLINPRQTSPFYHPFRGYQHDLRKHPFP